MEVAASQDGGAASSMTYDHWKTTNPQDEELGSQSQPGQDDESTEVVKMKLSKRNPLLYDGTISIDTLSTEQLRSLRRCAQRLFRESRADLKLLYAAALRGILEEMKRRQASCQHDEAPDCPF
jgi:hypothetical protein